MKSTFNSIVVEGTDLIGKSTLVKFLKTIFPNVSDRDSNISKHIGLQFNEESAMEVVRYIRTQPETLFIFLVADAPEVLQTRMKKRAVLDEYDAKCVEYNYVYGQTSEYIRQHKNDDIYNILNLWINDNNYVPYDLVRKVVEFVVKSSLMEWGIDDVPKVKGESKEIYKLDDANLSVISMIPSLYSFTFSRYDIVPGTDSIRSKLWNLFGTRINQMYHSFMINNTTGDATLDLIIHRRGSDASFLSSYLGTVHHAGQTYNIGLWEDSLPPIEVVWKKAHYGTMKHILKTVDQWPTRFGNPIENEGSYPNSIIRFDWRNPLPDKDECIPEDFANFYVDTQQARHTVNAVTHILQMILREKGYELIDLCYFINQTGNIIFSEITPDGMRIQKSGDSFDKDLWRVGKSKHELVGVWETLYNDLSN